MARWRRVNLSEHEQAVVQQDRQQHPNQRTRQKLDVIWLLHLKHSHDQVARITGVSRRTISRYLEAYHEGGLDQLTRWTWRTEPNELRQHIPDLKEHFQRNPPHTIPEASQMIFERTGIKRGETVVREFLKDIGMSWRRTSPIPVPPKKKLSEHIADQAAFLEETLQPAVDAAEAGNGHVFFVDAAHFTYGTYLTCLWAFMTIFVRAASGRQRFNVLGAWDAISRTLISVTNTSTVNSETVCDLLRKIASLGLDGPVRLVLDNAKYQRAHIVKELAAELNLTLIFLPPYSPNLNLIERLWKHVKSTSIRGRYFATFDAFKSSIETCLAGISTKHRIKLKSLMTLKFQTFENVPLLAA